MKLNPEDLDVMSFDTGAHGAQPLVVAGPDGAAVALAPTPTPNSRCFVCDYTCGGAHREAESRNAGGDAVRHHL